MHPDMLDWLADLTAILKEAPLWQVVLIAAALPAVCEELAFRGFILSGFRRPGHKWRAIVFSALFFGFVHGMFQRTLVSGLLGVVIGYLAVQSGSILPGMVFHILHNSLSVAWPRLEAQAVNDWPVLENFVHTGGEGELEFSWPVIAAGACLTTAILYWFQRLPSRKTR